MTKMDGFVHVTERVHEIVNGRATADVVAIGSAALGLACGAVLLLPDGVAKWARGLFDEGKLPRVVPAIGNQ